MKIIFLGIGIPITKISQSLYEYIVCDSFSVFYLQAFLSMVTSHHFLN